MRLQKYTDAMGEWRWRIRAANGRSWPSGEGYRNEADCNAAILLIYNWMRSFK